MILLPAIDLFKGQAVRLFKGDYEQMTVYDPVPANTACKFKEAGAKYMHLVDLEGARDGMTPNFDTICDVVKAFSGFVEVGGGIRTLDTVEKYLSAGVSRVILGTAAVTDPGLCREASAAFGERIAVGVDLRDGYVAIRGWTEKTALTIDAFLADMRSAGVKTLIVTDISRDGAMKGTNLALYEALSAAQDMRFIASGGVSTLDDIRALRRLGLYGAIVGKAYYTGAIDLKEALAAAGGES